MGSPRESGPFLFIILLVAVSLLLVAGGFALRRRGQLGSSRAALLWAILCVAPLFGAGFLMMAHHVVDQATGKTRSGVNVDPLGNATH